MCLQKNKLVTGLKNIQTKNQTNKHHHHRKTPTTFGTCSFA